MQGSVTFLGGFNSLRQDRRDAAQVGWIRRRNGRRGQIDLSYSFFLEPLLDPRGVSEQIDIGYAQNWCFWRGQTSFGDRLSPEFEETVGGLFTVHGTRNRSRRGTRPRNATAEYRFHLPRAMKVQPYPTKVPFLGDQFRMAPQQAFGRPDWDLVFRGFYDMGQTVIARYMKASEDDQFLASVESWRGAGYSAELFGAGGLWDCVTNDVPNGDHDNVQAGDQRFHFLVYVFVLTRETRALRATR